MWEKRLLLSFIVLIAFTTISFFNSETVLIAQERKELKSRNYYEKDSLILQKYYPKQRLSAVEFFAGTTFSTIKGVEETYSTPITHMTGFSVGIGLVHAFNKRFEIQSKFSWDRKGIRQQSDSITISPTGTISSIVVRSKQTTRSDYVTLSLVPQLFLGKRLNFNIGVGGYFGILQKSRVVIQYINPNPYLVRYQGAFNEYDYGLSLNAGYTFFSEDITRFTVQFSGSYGLKQISLFHDLYSFAPPLYNRSFSILLGIRLMNNRAINRTLNELTGSFGGGG